MSISVTSTPKPRKKQMVVDHNLHDTLVYNSETGFFTWKKKCGVRTIVGARAGSKNQKGYWQIKLGGRNYLAHRVAWFLIYGDWPSGNIDHIDGNKSNNAISNLRDINQSINCQNQRRARSDNKTGFLGVTARDSRFEAQIFVNGKNIRLGKFADPETAHNAYLDAKRKYHFGNTL